MAKKVGKTVHDAAKRVAEVNEPFDLGMIDLIPKQLLDKVLTRETLFEIVEEVNLLRFAKERLLLMFAFNYRPEKMEDFPPDMRENLDDLIRNKNHHRTPDWKRYKIQEIEFLTLLGTELRY